MGKRPETCWAAFKRQAINLRNCCIWLVDSFECMMKHGLTNAKSKKRNLYIVRFYVSHRQHVVYFRGRKQLRLSECSLRRMQSTVELQNPQYLAENLLWCLEVPIFRCNGEDGYFNPQTYSPFVVFILCAVRLTRIFLYLRNVLSDSLPHSFRLNCALPNLLPIPYIYSMRCHTHHHFLHVRYELSDSPPISFIYIMCCTACPTFYIYVVGCS